MKTGHCSKEGIDVTCVGVLVADVLAEGVDDGVFDRDMTRVNSVKLSTGGDAFNQAINISELGYKVRLCGKVGSDGIGRYLLNEANMHSIDTEHIKVDEKAPTSITIVLINKNGERNFIGTKNGTNSHLTIDNIDCDCFGDTKIVSLGSLYGSLTLDGEMAKTIMKKAKESSCTTVADMMHADRHNIDDAKKVLPYIDYFIPNYAEASELTKETDKKKICEILRGFGVKNIVIKTGKEGCYLSTAEGDKEISAYHVDAKNVIDTTGAGDAFVSGFITGLLDELPLKECCKRGCAAGAVTVQCVGATGGIKSKQQIIDIINA